MSHFVTNTSKPPLEHTLFSAPQIATTALPASVPPCYDNAPTDRSLDDDAVSLISCNASSVMDKDADNNRADNYDIGNSMPIHWSFPGFIAFALLGPIAPSGMVPYRSELLIASLPSGNDTSNGRAALRKTARSSK
jgi:hypothetical protein